MVMARWGLVIVASMIQWASPVSGSLQGLYIITSPEGQLKQLNWSTGESVDVGAPLTASGFKVEACAPTTIDPTGKWIYTLAMNVSDTAEHGLRLLAMELADGTLHRTRAALPHAVFPPTAAACDYALATDGGWDAYVTGVVGTHLRSLLVNMLDMNMPGIPPPPPPKVILDVTLAEVGLGGAAAVPTSTIDADNVLWVGLSGGVAGISLTTNTIDRRVVAPTGHTIRGIQGYGTIYGLLSPVGGGDTVLASFDAGPTPVLQVGNVSLKSTVAHSGTSFALLSDQKACVYINTAGRLVALDLTGRQISSAPGCIGGCPACISYEPFVFR